MVPAYFMQNNKVYCTRKENGHTTDLEPEAKQVEVGTRAEGRKRAVPKCEKPKLHHNSWSWVS